MNTVRSRRRRRAPTAAQAMITAVEANARAAGARASLDFSGSDEESSVTSGGQSDDKDNLRTAVDVGGPTQGHQRGKPARAQLWIDTVSPAVSTVALIGVTIYVMIDAVDRLKNNDGTEDVNATAMLWQLWGIAWVRAWSIGRLAWLVGWWVD